MLKCFCEEPLTLEGDAENWYSTCCGHVFHYLCLINWLERSKTCPQCRDPVTENQIFRLYPVAVDEEKEKNIDSCFARAQERLEMMNTMRQELETTIVNQQAEITRLKIAIENDKNSRIDNRAIIKLLQINQGPALDNLFNDPFELMRQMRVEIDLVERDEAVEAAVVEAAADEEAAVEAAAAEAADAAAAVAAVQATLSSNASGTPAEEATAAEGKETLDSALNTLTNMLVQMSQMSDEEN